MIREKGEVTDITYTLVPANGLSDAPITKETIEEIGRRLKQRGFERGSYPPMENYEEVSKPWMLWTKKIPYKSGSAILAVNGWVPEKITARISPYRNGEALEQTVAEGATYMRKHIGDVLKPTHYEIFKYSAHSTQEPVTVGLLVMGWRYRAQAALSAIFK